MMCCIHSTNFSKVLFIAALLCLLQGCVSGAPFRTGGIATKCYEEHVACNTATIEQHLEFDLAFVEFTQRGNLFDRDKSQLVIDYVNQHANDDKGAAVFVFAHGWKHNAASTDSNVMEFREMLSRAAENPFVGKRRVIGIYLGWRGKTTTLPFIKELSYWSRKSVAEEIGSGGATEILTELQQLLVEQFRELESNETIYKNTYVIIGHSFGGAIVLSALHDVLLEDFIATAQMSKKAGLQYCHKVRRFADGIVLVNPAIEANRMILLREAAAKCTFSNDQPSLMHIMSSEADLATNLFFPIGQYVNVTTALSPEKLKRNINGKSVVLNEHQLDVTTVGNFDQFRSGYLYHEKASDKWEYRSCRTDLAGCGIVDERTQENHITSTEYDPISFIKTDENFIKNHNKTNRGQIDLQCYLFLLLWEI